MLGKRPRRSTLLNSRGYVLRGYTPDEAAMVERDLTFQPQRRTDFGPPPARFKVFARDSSGALVLPRYYGINRFGPPDCVDLANGAPICHEMKPGFSLDPERSQDEMVRKIERVMRTPVEECGKCGLAQNVCGGGKTVCAIWTAINIVRTRTLVVVNTNQLMKQWEDRFTEFVPGIRVGRVGGGKVVTEGCDVIIAMLQTLTQTRCTDALLSDVGLMVIDECHLVNTKVFCRVLQRYNTMHILGLSATPSRADGMHKVIEAYIGPLFFSAERQTMQVDVEVRNAEVGYLQARYRTEREMKDRVSMITDMVSDNTRNELIASKVVEHHQKKVLVLSERREHLETLRDMITRHVPAGQVGLYRGGMKEAQLQASEGCLVILGTYSIASVGMDIKNLNVLVFATPRSDIKQACGRILRNTVDGVRKLIVDVFDPFGMFHAQFRKRLALYRAEGYALIGPSADAWRRTPIDAEDVLTPRGCLIVDED